MHCSIFIQRYCHKSNMPTRYFAFGNLKLREEGIMSATLINLIIQLIAGAVGGNAVGAGLKNFDLGTIGNTIAGALGGAGGGTLLTALLPILQGAAGGVDIGQLLGQAVGGGVAGAVVTAIVGLIKNAMAGQTAR
jgi:hypothetical protein